MDIDWTKFPHKIRMLRAYILQILSEMTKAEASRNESLHACKGPQKFRKVYRKKNLHYHTIHKIIY